MHRHDEVEAVLHTLEQKSPIINIDIELTLECVMNQHTSLDVDIVILRVPVCLEGYGDTIPSLRVSMSQPVSYTLNDALGQYSRLYIIRWKGLCIPLGSDDDGLHQGSRRCGSSFKSLPCYSGS